MIPIRIFCPSIVDVPLCAEKLAFHPPDSAMLLEILTTSVPEPVYVPTATLIVSPAAAFPIAPLIVLHELAALEHEFASFPVVATYQVTPVAASRLALIELFVTPL